MTMSLMDEKTRRPAARAADGVAAPSRIWKGLRPAVLATTLAATLASSAFGEVAPQLFGVNLGSGDATSNGVPGAYGHAYLYPSAGNLDYYKSKGLTLIRLNMKWKRIQQSPGQPLYETDMARIDNVIAMARARDMKVILDLHDYNTYGKNSAGEDLIIGQHPQAPAISTLVHLWGLIAERYKNEPAVYGYDLMNEPKGSVTNWKNIAQQIINKIRQHDSKTWILVEGIHSSRAWGWVKDGNGALIDLTDSADRLIYSAHSYWDAGGGSGTYDGTYASTGRYPEVGVVHVEPFVTWCVQNGVNGLIGEYGVPWNKGYVNEWNTVAENFMNYIKANGLSGTYWRGGPWEGNYMLTSEPTSAGVDRPIMSVLQNFNNTNTASEEIVDNSQTAKVTLTPATGGWVVSTSGSGGYGGSYLHDNNDGKGTRSVKFTPTLEAGNYDVFIRWVAHQNRDDNVPVTVTHAGGTTPNIYFDQTTDGDEWHYVGTYAFNAGTGGYLTIRNNNTTGHVVADAVKFTPASGLPAGWTNTDVGSVALPGSASHSGGVYTVTGSGATLGGTSDAFHFVSMPATGDCSITARVVTQSNSHNYARAGVMIREGTAHNARFADAIITPANGAYQQFRTSAGGSASTVSAGAGDEGYWLRVTRVGNVFTTEKSTNGTSWSLVSIPRTISMGSSTQIGLVVCAYSNNTVSTVTFDNVSVTQ